MKTFSKKEKEYITTIIALAGNNSISLYDLLEKLFFQEKEGRALIVQTVDHYAVFYLKNKLFDSEATKKVQLTQFLEFIALLNYLTFHKYLYFLPEDHSKKEKMYVLQDAFNSDPKTNDGAIILNAKGDHTSHPSTILDKDNSVVYQGIFLDADTSAFLEKHGKGVLLLSKRFKELTAKNARTVKKNKHKARQKFWWPMILNMLIMLKIGLATYLLWNKLHEYSPDLNTLGAYTTKITDKVDSVTTRLAALDQLLRKDIPERTDETPPQKKLFYGIDISHYNKAIVDAITASDSISFVICKATEGLHYRDPYFDHNWKTLKEKSIIRGAYHFYHTDSDPIQQAKHYLDVVKVWDATDIPPVVDVEGESLTSGSKNISKEKLQKDLLTFLEYVEANTQRKPMIYVSKPFADRYLLKKEFSGYPLWLADYSNRKTPKLPKTWKKTGYRIWQRSNNYHFKSTRDDLDVFYGKLTDLYK